MGFPKEGDLYGNGVPIVVVGVPTYQGGREGRPQGEGAQVVRPQQPCGTRDAKSQSGAERHLCWLLGTSVLEIGLFCTKEQVFLPMYVRCGYNQRGLFCAYAPITRLVSRRKGCICALSIFLGQATRLLDLLCAL